MTQLPIDFPDPTLSRSYDSIFELIGNTPLVRVNALAEGLPGKIYIKLDSFNVGGSSKDRLGLHLVREALAAGVLAPGGRVVDTGAGNTAIGVALVGNAIGHPSSTVPPPYLSPQKAKLLDLLGVERLESDVEADADDPQHPKNVARDRADAEPNAWWAQQSLNPDNPDAHFRSTGPEIWHQTEGRATHFIANIATGGTVSGAGRFLKTRNPSVQVIATDFLGSRHELTNLYPVVEQQPGHEQLERNWPENIDLDVIDRFERRERAFAIETGWRAARADGLLIGVSSALSLGVALELAAEAEEGEVFVVFSADHARDYLSREYDIDWLRENGFEQLADRLEAPPASAAPPRLPPDSIASASSSSSAPSSPHLRE